jgi:hypothetical protein
LDATFIVALQHRELRYVKSKGSREWFLDCLNLAFDRAETSLAAVLSNPKPCCTVACSTFLVNHNVVKCGQAQPTRLGLCHLFDLAEALGAATAVFRKMFNAMATLKALTYFGDGNLPSLPQTIQDRLRTSAEALKLEALPQVFPKPGIQRQDV